MTAGYQPADRDYYENDVGMNSCVGKPLPMNKLKEAIAIYSQNLQSPSAIVDLTSNTRIVPIDAERQSASQPSSTSMPFINGCTLLDPSKKLCDD